MLTNKQIRLLLVFILIPILTTLTISCGSSNPDNNTDKPNGERIPIAAMELETAADCSALKTYVTQSLVKRHTHIPHYPYYRCSAQVSLPTEGSPTSNPPPTSADATTGNGGADFSAPTARPDGVSGTNNQETGVNESDMVKVSAADGTLFIGHGSHLIIAKAFPPQDMVKLKEIDMGSQVINIFYQESLERVVVISRYTPPYYILAEPLPATSIIAPEPSKIETLVSFFDVTDRNNPTLTDHIAIDGYYQDSRRIENRLHLITRYYGEPLNLYNDAEFVTLKNNFNKAVDEIACNDPANYDPEVVANDPAVVAAKTDLAAKIESIVTATDSSALLPTARRGVETNQAPIPGFLQCTDVNFPKLKANLGMQVITSVDTDGSNVAATALVNNAWQTYVSKSHLYIAEWSNYWFWERPTVEQTAIYKFAISSGRPQYVATGAVDGHALNAFSFSEFNDVLRVATTERNFSIFLDPVTDIWVPPVPTNHLTILQDDGAGTLKTLSSIRDIAKGETIRSARFLDERGFIVTFRNVDPLFTFDLSDPANPQLKGKVTIPGFSSYMHPFDENHLLTVGRAGGANGTGLSDDVQLQLIDVTDMSKPEVISRYTPDLPSGSSWSDASYDHHAFTYYAPANLLAIPMQTYPHISGDQPFTGVMAFNVTVDGGIKKIGKVDHSDLAEKFYCIDNLPKASLSAYCGDGRYIGWASPRRTMVMTSGPSVYLYTLSDVGLKANEIADINTTIGSFLFPPQIYPWYGIPVDAAGAGGIAVEPTPAVSVVM